MANGGFQRHDRAVLGVLPERSLKQFSKHFRSMSPLSHEVRMQGALFFGRLASRFLKQHPLLTDCH
jgi:hypothetical protein